MNQTATDAIDAVIKARTQVLMDLSKLTGLTALTRLSDKQRALFDLRTNEAQELAEKLSDLRERIVINSEEDKLAVETAYAALGITEYGSTPQERNQKLLISRYGTNWTLDNVNALKIQEGRGFAIMVKCYVEAEVTDEFIKQDQLARAGK